jgi:ribonuclease Z
MDKDFFTLTTDHFTIEGRSRAGHETYFRIRDLGVVLDIGRCPDLAVGVPNIFVTHAHLDHAVGIPFYAGQRHLHRLSGGRVFVPAEAAEGFREILRIHARLANTKFEEIEIIGVAPGDVVRLGRTHEVRVHASTHRVATNAYEIVEVRHRLRDGFEGLAQEEIHRRRAEVIEEYRQPMLFYTGDTDRGILESNDAIYRSEVLMIECSFIMDGHQDSAAKYRHIHFDDIADFADRFENRVVILTHFSRRYGRSEIQQEIARRCPAALRPRLRLALPQPYQRV